LLWLEKFIRFCATNEIVMGLATIAGLVSFGLSIFVSIRTAKISKVLAHNSLTDSYNKERLVFLKGFLGHRTSIIEDANHSEQLRLDILKLLTTYREKFGGLMSYKEKFSTWKFSRMLMRKTEKVDFHKVSTQLSLMTGRLEKKEERIHG